MIDVALDLAQATPADASRAMRTALGRFATGVTLITCRDANGVAVGLTANSFNALSLDPPLVLWSLRADSPSAETFGRASHFGINVLAESQVDLSRRFAARVADKFGAGLWHDGLHGLPLLLGAAATFECRRQSQQAAGDHLLFIGQVLQVTAHAAAPLLFHAGHYKRAGPLI